MCQMCDDLASAATETLDNLLTVRNDTPEQRTPVKNIVHTSKLILQSTGTDERENLLMLSLALAAAIERLKSMEQCGISH